MIEEMGCLGGLSYGSPTRKRGDEDVRRMTDQGPCMSGKDAGDGKDSLLSLTTPPNTGRAASKGVPWTELCSPKTHVQKP